MVSILPQKLSPFQLIGKAMSDLGRNTPQLLENRYQTERGLGAIDQLQQALGEAGGDINQILPALAKAYTLNPALERSGLGPHYLQQAQRQNLAENFPIGGEQGKVSKPVQPEVAQEPGPISVTDLVPPRQSSLVGDPQSAGGFQLPYGENEIAQIRQRARELKLPQALEDRAVADALEYNKIAQTKRDIGLQNYQQQQKERQDTLENQALFNKYIRENAPEFTGNPDELQLALQAGEKYQGEKSFADRLAKVKEELRPYQAAKKGLEKILKRPLFGQTKEQRNLARPRAQTMVKMGQKPQLQLMIANGGNGEVEEADLLNPLPEKFESNLNKFGKFVKPLDFVKNIDPDSPEYNKDIQEGQKRLDNQKKYMTNFLADNITSGTYNEPGTNLLLTRFHLMEKGLSWEDSGQVIDNAINQGKIKLDPQQQIDYQKLAYPPLTGDTYFDTVMNNIMFPITGRQ